MKKKTLILALGAATVLSLSGCGGKDKEPVPTQPSIEAIQPTETEPVELNDPIDTETDKITVETIGVKEVENSSGEKETVGVLETLAGDSFEAVDSGGDTLITLNKIDLTSKHEYTEEEALALDNLIDYWIDNPSEHISFIEEQLKDEVYSGLDSNDKDEIINKIKEEYPHNDAVETEPAVEETEAGSETAEEDGDEHVDMGEYETMSNEEALERLKELGAIDPEDGHSVENPDAAKGILQQ